MCCVFVYVRVYVVFACLRVYVACMHICMGCICVCASSEYVSGCRMCLYTYVCVHVYMIMYVCMGVFGEWVHI